ncbi:MAG: DinB family protein [Candidatus Cloacimonetes bacterium]|nr:DinB family protein [Candidatus Cloacimonadota bacterium]
MDLDHDENNLLGNLELDQVMYDHTILLEELKISRDYIKAYWDCFSDEELFRVPSGCSASPAQHIGHIAYTEKELGKKIGMSFPFKLDLFDDVFSTVSYPSPKEEMPKRDELYVFVGEIHDVFMSELKYHKKREVLFAIVNHNYVHSAFLRGMVLRYGYDEPVTGPASNRVHVRMEPANLGRYFLPVFAN